MEDGKALRLLGFFGAALGTEPLSFRSLRLNPSWSQGTGDCGVRGACCNPKILPWLDWMPSLISHLWDLRPLGWGCRDRGPGNWPPLKHARCFCQNCWSLEPESHLQQPGVAEHTGLERVYLQVQDGLSGLGSMVPAPSLCASFGG